MKNILKTTIFSYLAIIGINTAHAGNMWGDQNLPLLSEGDAKIDNMYNNSNITTMNGGEIGAMASETFVDTMNGGTIDSMTTNAHVNNLNYGNIGTIQGSAYVVNMNDGTISWLRQRSFVNTMTTGTINRIGDDVNYDNAAHVKLMNGGNIGSITGNGYIITMKDGNIEVVNTNGTFTTLEGGTIKDFEKGTVTNMQGTAKTTNFKGGSISNMQGSAHITSMTGGFINSINSAGAKINTLSGGYVNNLYNGEITTVSGSAYISHMSGGTINKVNTLGTFITHSGGTINTFEAGEIGNMNGTAKIIDFNNGKISHMYGTAEISDFNNGTITNMSNSAKIGNLYGNAKIERMTGGSITSINDLGNRIENMSGGTITNLKSGHIEKISGGSIGTMSGDSFINEINGTARITNLNGGIINTMDKSSYISVMNNGTINTVQNPTYDGSTGIGTMNDGTIKKLIHNSTIDIMNGGTIEHMNNVSKINTINNGTIKFIDGLINIAEMKGGTIEDIQNGIIATLDGGKIDNLAGSSIITNFDSGFIETATAGSSISTMSSGTINLITSGSRIDRMDDGNVKSMRQGAYINSMYNGLVENMYDGSDIKEIHDGKIQTIYSGKVGDIYSAATIEDIKGVTIYGKVENGPTLNLSSNGYANIKAKTKGNVFDRNLIAGNNSHIEIKDYVMGTNSSFDMGNNSTIVANSIEPAKVNYRGNGTFRLSNYGEGGFINTTIKDFSASGNVTFEMNVDEAVGGGNDSLTITTNSGSSNLHHLAIGSEHTSQTNREKIDLVRDESNSLSFKLHSGKYVGLGAKNYYLNSAGHGNGKIWSLILGNSLSDQALVIGSVASANLASVYAIQSSLHQRMGDIRSQQKEGIWARTYTNQSSFKELSSTDIDNYGVEAGADKKLTDFGNGKLAVGFGVGMLYSDTNVKTYNSKNGEADSIMPYAGIYATWSNCDGFYIDAVAKYIYNDTNGHYYDGVDYKKDFNVNTHIGNVSLEGGYQYKLASKYVLEPRAQLSYSFIKGDTFTDSAGYKGKYEDTQSLLGTLGIIARYDYSENVQYYTKASVLYEFDGKSDITYDNIKYKSDIGGTRGEIGVGFMLSILNNINLYAEAAYQTGSNSYQSINGNLGLYWKF